MKNEEEGYIYKTRLEREQDLNWVEREGEKARKVRGRPFKKLILYSVGIKSANEQYTVNKYKSVFGDFAELYTVDVK